MRKFFKYKFSKRAQRRAELRVLAGLLAIVLGLACAATVVLWQMHRDEGRRVEIKTEAQQAVATPDVPPQSKSVGGPFKLVDQNGKIVTDATYKGKYLLIYFGYTYCPDMCPTGLQSIAHALDTLGPDAKKVQTLYVTIDPTRDTSAKLKEYTASFHKDIIGLTGTASQIAVIAKEYQVYYAKGEQVDEHDYMMDHSSLIYLMDPNGKLVATFPENADPAAIVKALRDKGAVTVNSK